MFKMKKRMIIRSFLQYDSELKYDNILISTIFEELLTLPLPPSKNIFYSSILIKLTEEDSETGNLKTCVQKYIDTIFIDLNSFDLEL